MALPALATVDALEIRLGLAAGSLSGADLARATANLQDASALVRAAAGKSWVDPVDGVTVTAPDVVVAVVLQAAKRAFQNPEGIQQESISSGGYWSSWADAASAGVILTPDERGTVVAAARGSGGPFVGSVGTPSAYSQPATAADVPTVDWGLL